MALLPKERLALEELARRKARRDAASQTVAALKAELFGLQRDVWESPSKLNAVICPRRAGKTSLWARLAVGEAWSNDRKLVRIWHVSRIICKQLLWRELLNTLERHGVKHKANEVELTILLDNGSEIRLCGADKDKEVQKKRGSKSWVEIVLEAQNFGSLLKGLVEDVVEPCLLDEKQFGGGKLYLEGTPGIVCGGHWYEITGRDERLRGSWDSVGVPGWQCFRWQSVDNPFMPHIAAEIIALRLKRRWTDDNPTYCREYRGLWVNDYDALFYKYNEARNSYDGDFQPFGKGWHHVLGWDLGSLDDMALVAWAYHDNLPDLYEAYSWKKPGALSAEVMAQLDDLERRGFNFVAMVADTQGGGKMYVEDVHARYSRQFEPAAKSEKWQHVTLFNDDLYTGRVKLKKGSPYEEEIRQLPRDPDWEPSSGKAPAEAVAFANHCCDAGLYAWRKARYYWNTPKHDKPKAGSNEALMELEAEIVQHITARREREQRDYLEEYVGDVDFD